jgi:hypothetical protein
MFKTITTGKSFLRNFWSHHWTPHFTRHDPVHAVIFSLGFFLLPYSQAATVKYGIDSHAVSEGIRYQPHYCSELLQFYHVNQTIIWTAHDWMHLQWNSLTVIGAGQNWKELSSCHFHMLVAIKAILQTSHASCKLKLGSVWNSFHVIVAGTNLWVPRPFKVKCKVVGGVMRGRNKGSINCPYYKHYEAYTGHIINITKHKLSIL